MSEWRPIETAPKDGTWIVIGKADWDACPVAKWELVIGADEWFGAWLFASDAPCLVPNVDGEAMLGWQEDVDEGNMPTHWMPRPALSEATR